MSEITVAAIQMKMNAQPAENIARAEALVRDAAEQGAQIRLDLVVERNRTVRVDRGDRKVAECELTHGHRLFDSLMWRG